MSRLESVPSSQQEGGVEPAKPRLSHGPPGTLEGKDYCPGCDFVVVQTVRQRRRSCKQNYSDSNQAQMKSFVKVFEVY